MPGEYISQKLNFFGSKTLACVTLVRFEAGAGYEYHLELKIILSHLLFPIREHTMPANI